MKFKKALGRPQKPDADSHSTRAQQPPGHPDLEAALSGLDSALPTLLLSHRPEIFPEAAACGIPLTLAGHYHGGQIKLSLPGGDFTLAQFMTPYPEGLYRLAASHL